MVDFCMDEFEFLVRSIVGRFRYSVMTGGSSSDRERVRVGSRVGGVG